MTEATTSTLPGQPNDDEGPVFRDVWEAQAFALTLSLHERGLFEWTEWASTLANEIKAAQAAGDPDLGTTYYHHWLNALERLVVEKGATTAADLSGMALAWEDAARATPHGQPIVLEREAQK